MARKVIQFTVVYTPGFLGVPSNRTNYVVCDDGTVWAKQPHKNGDEWDQITDLPPSEDK